jgi:hypothetical protein
MRPPTRAAIYVAASKPAMTRFPSLIAVLCIVLCGAVCHAQQNAPAETPQQELQRLKHAVDQAQAQVDASQQQLLELKESLSLLEQRFASGDQAPASTEAAPAPASPLTPPVGSTEVAERQAMEESQIATLNQIKVESESKYPVKITGLILLNGFVNTSQVDNASAPTIAIAGSGSTGASMRQTVLGIDARGPTLAGATSRADVRVDFFANSLQSDYEAGDVLRLRTAHATLNWKDTEAFVELDRPIISPNQPASLTAIGEPALAWSGNLWMWSPQLGAAHTIDFIGSSRMEIKTALIDVPDSPAIPAMIAGTVSQGERSRWPGGELHIGLLGKKDSPGASVGVGGYFSPHKILGGIGYNAWAGTLDADLRLPHGLEFSGSFYRGLALGGLGGGAYKDFVYGTSLQHAKPLNDVGGWAQLEKRAGLRWEFNGAFGMDNGFAAELRRYVLPSTAYQNQARNQTFTANTIYSPSAYLLFSLEYRHLTTTPIIGAPANTNIIGVAAGYKF